MGDYLPIMTVQECLSSAQRQHVEVEANRDRLREALERAYEHLLFNAWKDDLNSDRRFKAVQEVLEALGIGENADSDPGTVSSKRSGEWGDVRNRDSTTEET